MATRGKPGLAPPRTLYSEDPAATMAPPALSETAVAAATTCSPPKRAPALVWYAVTDCLQGGGAQQSTRGS
jgi:hypothetical protein